MLKGNIYIMSDMDMVMKLSTNHKIICISGETHEYQQFIDYTNAIVGSILLPPYDALCAEIEGNLNGFKQLYYEYLAAKCSDFFAIIIRSLYMGINIILFLTQDEEKMNYIKIFSEYMNDNFGIIIGNQYTHCMYNTNFNDYNLTLMLKYNLFDPTEYLNMLTNVSLLDLDNTIILKLKDMINPVTQDITFEGYKRYFKEYKNNIIKHGNKKLIEPIRSII